MTLDCDKYRINLSTIQGLMQDKTPEERVKFIGNVAVACTIPIIVVTCYTIELFGSTPELEGRLERLMDFYQIKEILNRR